MYCNALALWPTNNLEFFSLLYSFPCGLSKSHSNMNHAHTMTMGKLPTKESNLHPSYLMLPFKLAVILNNAVKKSWFQRVCQSFFSCIPFFPHRVWFLETLEVFFQPNSFIARKQTYFHVIQWAVQLSSQFEVQSCGNASKWGSQGFAKDSQSANTVF